MKSDKCFTWTNRHTETNKKKLLISFESNFRNNYNVQLV